jgi:hypothetical protein
MGLAVISSEAEGEVEKSLDDPSRTSITPVRQSFIRDSSTAFRFAKLRSE